MAQNKAILKYWWDAKDAPVDNKWVDRVSGLAFVLHGSNVYDSTNKIYDFSTASQYGELVPNPNEANFSMKHHWKLEFDLFVNRQQSTSMIWIDMGSVAKADHAIGFGFGANNGTDNGFNRILNWKISGNSSNPFSSTPSHPALPIIPANEFVRVTGYYMMLDGGDGYDRAEVKINGAAMQSNVKVPKVTYGPTWNLNMMRIGATANDDIATYNTSCKVKYVKIWVID